MKGKTMTELNNPESKKKRGWSNWSVVRKAQIIGASIGALLTIGILILDAMIVPSIFSNFGALSLIIELPAIFMAKAFHLPQDWFVSDSTTGASYLLTCLTVFNNGILGFLLGGFIGWVKSKNILKK
jgi:hypothetical protein